MMCSAPFVAGHYVHVGDLPGVFKVLAFDGHTYRLRSQFGAELKAGRKAVRAAPDKPGTPLPAGSSNGRK